jgi:hypothetical protein
VAEDGVDHGGRQVILPLKARPEGAAREPSPGAASTTDTRRSADFAAILTADFLTVPEDQIMTIKAYMTIVDGKVVHEAQPAR